MLAEIAPEQRQTGKPWVSAGIDAAEIQMQRMIVSGRFSDRILNRTGSGQESAERYPMPLSNKK